MQRAGLSFVCVAVCCLNIASEPLNLSAVNQDAFHRRPRSSNDKESLALSEIFRNITKQLRENINRESATSKADQLLQNKVENSRQFSSYQGSHHHEHHWGPYFEGEMGQIGAAGTKQVKAHVGSEALLNCRVGMLKDKTVMWLRRTSDSAQLLTVGPLPYAGDNRIAVKFQYPNNWRLSVNQVKRGDAGLYMCQISTHPPRAILANLTVLPPVLTINGDETHTEKDRFYKTGSSIQLACTISDEYIHTLTTKRPISTTPLTTIRPTTTTESTTKTSTFFNRIDLVMNKSWSVETTTITSTISVSTTTEKPLRRNATTPLPPIIPTKPPIEDNIYDITWLKQGKPLFDGVTFRNTSAILKVQSVTQNDTGTYTCSLQNHSKVSLNVHVLIGENPASPVHHNTSNSGNLFWKHILTMAVISAILVLRL